MKEHLAQFYLQAGDKAKAEQSARQAWSSAPNQVQPLANYVEVLYLCGKKAEALKQFEELRKMSGSVDLEAPVFQRLSKIAVELNLPADWRTPRATPDDILDRPDLATLGPLGWRPSPAVDWTLPQGDGKPLSLSAYRNRPVIVIFYLGYGCLHCAQQLEKFAPMAEQFKQAGIDLVAISTDSIEDVKKSEDRYRNETEEPREFPFPLVADPALNVFKKYRVYDDFEKMALHGTFLIDSEGLVRWQDIGYEPFMEAEFLLKESQRLLGEAVKK